MDKWKAHCNKILKVTRYHLDQISHIRIMKLFRKLMPFLVGYSALEEFGFEAPNSFRKHFCRFNSLMGYVVYVSCTILMGGFLVFEAETFEDISEHFYEFATGMSETFYYVYVHLMCKQFFEMCDHFEAITKKRELLLLWIEEKFV